MPGAAARDLDDVGTTDTRRPTAEVVGLYLDPPEKALVLGLERSGGRHGLGEPRRRGAWLQWPATPVARGKVRRRVREADVLAFLELVEKQVPADLEVLAILTSGSAGAGQLLARWLEDPPAGPGGTCSSPPPAHPGRASSSRG